tara:strand:+ start:119 stop:922 length:804 start_codon:yes stop_codon:yes gene_type:complete
MIKFKNILKKSINFFFSLFSLRVVSNKYYKKSLNNKELIRHIEVFPHIKKLSSITEYIKNIPFSESQKNRVPMDLFVLQYLDFKKNGYFVEFGAANGKYLSNTYLMEKKFGWKGILCEPAVNFQKELKNNRNCIIENLCVWNKSNEQLDFIETGIPEHSTITKFSLLDKMGHTRKKGNRYKVNTITLNDLFEKNNSPSEIDYLSIDTEGSEFEILENLNHDKYKFKFITCEHMYTNKREKIYNLLLSKGYKRIFENFSLQDDWYVRN